MQRGGAAPCGRVTALLDAHIAEIHRSLADLRRLRRTLTGARTTARNSQRRGEDKVACRIIDLIADRLSASLYP